MTGATLDHIVVDTRERLDEAASAYEALGFQLTPRGHHTLGSANNLAILTTNYLELLGFGKSGATRMDLLSFPVGMNGLVFKTDDAAATERAAKAGGLAATDAAAFSRPVELAGVKQDAKFRTTHLPPDVSGIGRVYFCEHLTPHLVWRPEWQAHPNGAREIVRVLVATDDPARQLKVFNTLFGDQAITTHSDSAELALSNGGAVVLRSVAAMSAALGDAAPTANGRANYLAGFVLRVADLAAVTRLLHGIPGVIADTHRVTVPARAAFNATIIFEDAHAG